MYTSHIALWFYQYNCDENISGTCIRALHIFVHNKQKEGLTWFQCSPSHDGRIFVDELIRGRTGWWQTNGWNFGRVCDGWVYRQDGNVIQPQAYRNWIKLTINKKQHGYFSNLNNKTRSRNIHFRPRIIIFVEHNTSDFSRFPSVVERHFNVSLDVHTKIHIMDAISYADNLK